jgi:hypothetical protein
VLTERPKLHSTRQARCTCSAAAFKKEETEYISLFFK